MFYRIKQFYLSITAKVTIDDIKFAFSYLDKKEQELFTQLQISEQKHSINVAKDMEIHVDHEKKYELIRLALLHDIGKIKCKLNPIDKSIIVILDKISKGKLEKKSKFKKVNSYYNHGQIGYHILKEVGGYDEEFLQIIKNHHKKDINNNEVLYILQEWDNKN